MIKNTPRKSFVDHLNLDNFISYLRSTGWRRVKYQDDRRIVFANYADEGEPPFLIALPANEQFSDFTSRIAEAVRRLADVEQTSLEDVIQKIQSVQDIIYLHLSLPHNDFPSLETTSRFLRDTSYYLREAAEYLERTADADFEGNKTVEGLIINLHSEDQTARVVTVLAEGFGKVSFSLEPNEYAIACNAHRDGYPIIAKGQLVRQGKRGPLTLLSPHDFQMNAN